MRGKSPRTFTLIEIVICIAILGATATTLGIQLSRMVGANRFSASVKQLVATLKQGQLIALSDRIDLCLEIDQFQGEYRYRLCSDEPLFSPMARFIAMKGVDQVKQKGQQVGKIFVPIYRNGVIFQDGKIDFIRKGGEGLTLDLTSPLLVRLEKGKPLL